MNTEALIRALQTVDDVELAVVVGSRARGGYDAGSDIDVLTALADPTTERWVGLEHELALAAGVKVDLCSLVAWAQVPMFWNAAIDDDGQVLLDRHDRWPSIRSDPDTERERLQCPYTELAGYDQKAVHWMRWRESRTKSLPGRREYLAWCSELGLEFLPKAAK